MNASTPHYLLYSEASRTPECGRWRFVLQAADGSDEFEAADVEPDVRGERLGLLTVVRALESLDQPSQVTVVGCCPYVRQGMEYGLPEWRGNGWRWEFYGEMVPVKNCDLWQRLDRVMRFHQVDCRRRRFDAAHGLAGPIAKRRPWGGQIDQQQGTADGRRLGSRIRAASAEYRRGLTAVMRLWRRRLAFLVRVFSVRPWGRIGRRGTASG